jgi:hypothetical protein
MDYSKKSALRQKITNILSKHQNIIISTVEAVKNEGISNYPIIMVHGNSLKYELGIPILEDQNILFSITTLEELFAKMVISHDKISSFREVYNHKEQEFCVFIIEGGESEFFFIPKDS